jgi:hypothetical protein
MTYNSNNESPDLLWSILIIMVFAGLLCWLIVFKINEERDFEDRCNMMHGHVLPLYKHSLCVSDSGAVLE